MNRSTSLGSGLVLLGLLAIAGCSASAGAPPATFPVLGKVMYKGQPMTGGKINFEPDGRGREAYGTIQDDGTFKLSTYGVDDGAVPGTHRVSVTGRAKGVRSIPAKYGSLAASKIEVEVTSGKTDYTIELE